MEFDGGHLQPLKADLTMSCTSRGKERNLKNLITCFALIWGIYTDYFSLIFARSISAHPFNPEYQ